MATKKKDLSAGISALDRMFSGYDPKEEVAEATQEAQEAPVKVDKTKSPAQGQKGSEEPQKPIKKVFSFRADSAEADSWRAWADASGLKVEELGQLAIREYIKRHPLKGDKLQIYELKMSQKKEH